METYERRHRESLRRRDAETREVCQRLEQEEANVHALREEVNSKDSDLKRVITSNKKVRIEHLILHYAISFLIRGLGKIWR